MQNPVVIYLADLANTGFGCSPATVPLAIGYIKAYAASRFVDDIEVRLFRTCETLFEKVKVHKPAIIGCSWYGWNENLTVNALDYIKTECPDILTVVGGANAPEDAADALRDFTQHPCLDVLIPNEGEIAFADVIGQFLQGGRKAVLSGNIPGAFCLSRGGGSITGGKLLPRAEDINVFPSAYLTGCLDEFLIEDLMPILQTSRGCPFHCCFCASAKESWNKIKLFDIARVKEEIDYIETRAKDRRIRFADENFGIVKRDAEIARYISEKRRKANYPSGLRVYTHKVLNDTVKEIVTVLRDLIPLNISCQTLSESVLIQIGRTNVSREEYGEAIDWAHRRNLNVTTETIFGLPGETYSSYMASINSLLEMRVDSVANGTLTMLKETELARPEVQEQYGYRVLYNAAEQGYTKCGDFESVEIDSWAVASNSFSFDEYLKVNLFMLVYDLFMFSGYFKEVAYMWENRGVRVADVINELLDRPAEYAFFARQLRRQGECLRRNLFESKTEVRSVICQRYRMNDKRNQYIGFDVPFSMDKILKGEMIHVLNQKQMIDEVMKSAFYIFDAMGTGSRCEFIAEMDFATELVGTIIVPFWEIPEEHVVVTSPYDMMAWRSNNYKGVLQEYKMPAAVKLTYSINSIGEYFEFVKTHRADPFHVQAEHFWRSFRSNNIRRFLS